MKVLMVNSDAGHGSTGKLCMTICEEIRARGGMAWIAYGRECTHSCKGVIKIGNKFSVYLHAFLTRVFDMQGFASRYATKRFLKKVDQMSPDVIHLHNLHGSYINVRVLFAYIRKKKIPVIWTLHDSWSYTGHCSGYVYEGCNRWKTGCFSCPQKKIYPASLLLDASKRNYAKKKEIFTSLQNMRIVTVSDWLHLQVSDSFLNRFKIFTIPNYTDIGKYTIVSSDFRNKYHLEEKIVLLGVSSVWHDRKGLKIFIELASRLDESFQIVLVGVSTRKKEQLPSNIICLERTENEGLLAQIYAESDIFVNASKEESFGLVTLEALSCGTPVITNKYSANPELVDDSCGTIVSEMSVEAYIQAIHKLLKRKIKREDCIKRAGIFSKADSMNLYIQQYEDMMENEKNILWITNVPSPYRVDFFNELGKQCKLTVLFERDTSYERDESWKNYKFINFRGIILKGFATDHDKAFCPQAIKYMKEHRWQKIVVSDIATLTGILVILYMQKNKIPYWLEGDGGFYKEKKSLKEWGKKVLISHASGYFSTSKAHDEYWLHYGASTDMIFRYPFTSLQNTDIRKAVISMEEKNNRKKELKVSTTFMIITAGQFIHRKGFDVLLKAFSKIEDTSLYLIGGTPKSEYTEIIKEKKLENIYFLPFQSKEELKQYYEAADFFVLPTREDIWGLVINEAMGFGLPIITTDQCIAGLELIEENKNGFIVESENVEALHDKMQYLLNHTDVMLEMSENNLQKINNYTIQRMAERHLEIFEKYR